MSLPWRALRKAASSATFSQLRHYGKEITATSLTFDLGSNKTLGIVMVHNYAIDLRCVSDATGALASSRIVMFELLCAIMTYYYVIRWPQNPPDHPPRNAAGSVASLADGGGFRAPRNPGSGGKPITDIALRRGFSENREI
jgi:hypothetical protein